MTISLADIPENVLTDIFQKCGFLSIFVLRKVCRQFRNFIDDVKPCTDITLIEVEVDLKGIRLQISSNDWRISEFVNYEIHEKGCVVSFRPREREQCSMLPPPFQRGPIPEYAQRGRKFPPVTPYNGPKLKECILEGVDLMTAFSKDFQAVIGVQRSKIQWFSIRLDCLRSKCPTRSPSMTRSNVYGNPNEKFYGSVTPYTMFYFEKPESKTLQFFNTLEQTLQSRKQLLKVEDFRVESIKISSPKPYPYEEFKMDRLVTLNQWKQAKNLDLRSFHLSSPIINFLHFNSAKVHLDSMSCEDLKTMQQVFISSANFKSFETAHNRFEGKENLVKTFGEAETNGRWYFWIFPIPESENVLFLNVILCHPRTICFTRCSESTPPQKGCINCFYSY